MLKSFLVKFLISLAFVFAINIGVKYSVDTCINFYGDEYSRIFKFANHTSGGICGVVRKSEQRALVSAEHDIVPTNFFSQEKPSVSSPFALSARDFSLFTFYYMKYPASGYALLRISSWLIIFSLPIVAVWEWLSRISKNAEIEIHVPSDDIYQPLAPQEAEEQLLDDFFEPAAIGIPDEDPPFRKVRGSEVTPPLTRKAKKKEQDYLSGLFSAGRGDKDSKD